MLEEDLRFHRIAVLFIIFVGLIIYSNSISSSFHFDDLSNIVCNLNLRDMKKIPLLFRGDRNPKDNPGIPYSRALAGSTFTLNYYLGGLKVEGYHWVNLSLHLLNGILVYFFVGLLLREGPLGGDASRGNLLPLFAALFFVANPVQTHGVTYITQRSGEMATLFYLLSLILFIRAVSGERLRVYPYLGSLLCLLCGLWSKEEVYTAPVIFFLYYLAFVAEDWRRPTLSRGLRLLLPYIVLVGLGFYLGVMAWYSTFKVNWQWGRWEYLLTQASVIVEYIKLLVLPLPRWLNADVDFPIAKGLWEGYTLFSIGVIVLLVGTSILLLKTVGPLGKGGTALSLKQGRSSSAPSERRKGRLLAFGILWFFITLSPSSSVIPLQEIMVVYRLYLPGIGFCLVWVICIHKAFGYLWGRGGFGTRGALVAEIVVFSTLLLGYSVGAYEHNKVWKDEITLWEDTVKKSPMKARPHCNLGWAYCKKGLYDQAIRELEEAIRLKPDYAEAHNNLGWVYGKKDMDDLAIRQYEEAIRLKPDYAEAHNNLGVAYGEKGLYDLEVKQYEEAIKLKPDYAGAYYNLGVAYAGKGLNDLAISQYEEAIRLKPNDAKVYSALGMAYAGKGLYDQAIRQYEEAVRIRPDYAEVHNNLGIAYTEKGLNDLAIRQFEEAIRLKPDYAEAYYNLGVAYAQKGLYGLAIGRIEQAVRIKPGLREACELLDELYRLRGR